MLRIRSICVSLVVTVCALGITPSGLAQPTGYEGYQVVRIQITDDAELETLRGLQALGRDFQVWSHAVRIGEIEVRVAPTAQPVLKASGLRHEVITEDLQQYLDTLYLGARGVGFCDSLRTYEEHVEFMNDLVAAYPALAEMIEVGLSVEGRSMWALRITGAGDIKPGVMYHGAEHGNEQAPASVVADVAHYLLTNYDTDPEVAALVDHVEWFLLPIMNPDGYVAYDRWNANGVDLNRNWDGPGSGQSPWGGPYPFSEPETAAMRDFFQEHPNVRMHIDLHGYVPWIMWPWAHIPDTCPDHARFEPVGAEFRDRIAAAGGGWYTIGTIYDVAYQISGCSTDYTYGELGLWAFAIEVVDSNMPNICEEFLSSMLYMGEWMWDTDCHGNGIDDTCDIDCGPPGGACDLPDCGLSQDCNTNGIPDECDIDGGESADDNDNGVPDECECPADFDGDGVVGPFDLSTLLGEWGPCDAPCEPGDPATTCAADLSGDCAVGAFDLAILLGAWGPCE